jgi:hypothetical protein
MRQIRERMRRAREKHPRVHNIILKSLHLVAWSPIIVTIYIQAQLLTFRYNKEKNHP